MIRTKLIAIKPRSILVRLFMPKPMLAANSTTAGEFVQKLEYTIDDLIASLSNTLKLHDYEVKKSKSIAGKLLGGIFGVKNPYAIEIDGSRLYQLCKQANIQTEEEFLTSRHYLTDVEDLRKALKAMAADLQQAL